MLDTLFAKYDRLVLFDTETTGLIYSRDEIIEFAAVVVEKQNGEITVVQEYDQLIALSPGGFVPPQLSSSQASPTRICVPAAFPKPACAAILPG